MGLDLVVEGCAKPGHEAEWLQLLQRAYSNDQLADKEISRFNEISIPGYEHIGAPRVGEDAAADAWIIAAREAQTPEEIATTLKEYSGYYAVQLLNCDGVPKYSNGGIYDNYEVDETSFRGDFLKGCGDVLDKQLLAVAWEHKLPDAAIEYGRALLEAANTAELSPVDTHPGFLVRLGLVKAAERFPLSEQIDIVREAGRWYIFWGERGHPIRAWF